MAQGKYQARDVKGLTPGLDATQSNELFALGGRNYVFDSLGVKSPFGDRLVSAIPLGNPFHVQGVRLKLRGGDRCFMFMAFGIVEWLEDTGTYQYIYVTDDTTLSPYRWTFEYLNAHLYFAHPQIGLLAYNIDTSRCERHEDVGVGTPTQIICVTQNNGRLCVLTPTIFAWSAPSNGLDFTPTFGGSGFQVLAERVAGDAIMSHGYARGVLTWTTGGVMRSEFSGDAAVFRHRTLNTEYRPINSFCTVRIDEDTIIVLDERGLFQSRGESLTPYAPLFNEFLITFLQENKYRNGTNVRLEWDDRQRRLYVSYSDSYANAVFEKCFVYYPPLDKWGEFNEPHYGILPVRIANSERADDYFGFVDATGCLRYWKSTGSREDLANPLFSTANLYLPALSKPAQFAADEIGMRLNSSLRISTFSRAGMVKIEGYYANNVLTPLAVLRKDLNALVRFGYMRLEGTSAADQMSEITSVILRSVKSGDSDLIAEDFNLVPDGVANIDYNVGIGSEDLGLNPINYINHTFELVGTVDGDSEFVRQTPFLESYQKAARFYSCSVVGIWIIAEIGAASVGDAFHLKTFELTGVSAGRFL